MTRQRKPARGIPYGPLLAIIGGIAGFASLSMTWFVFNTAGLNAAIANIGSSVFAKDQATQGLPTDHLQAGMRAGLAQVSPQYVDKLHGYQIYSHTSVMLEAGAAGLAILVGLLGVVGLLRSRGLILFVCAIGLFGRPFYSLVIPPASSTLEPMGFEHAHLLSPTFGFWLSIIAGTIVLASTFGISARAAIPYEAPAGKYGAGAYAPTPGAAPSSGAAAGGNPYMSSPEPTYAPAPFVPGVGGAMHSSAGGYGSTPAVYGTEPMRAPQQPSGSPTGPGALPGSGGSRRSVAPPKF
ncbi:MAG: hypothetical protein AAGC46_08935 [Solirubrobacteraceae bacterium]